MARECASEVVSGSGLLRFGRCRQMELCGGINFFITLTKYNIPMRTASSEGEKLNLFPKKEMLVVKGEKK